MISIIVPIYNVKGYLYQCVESVKNQTFKDWECILVDDGSTDGCAIVCDEYVQQDSRIKVIHKKNGGLSDARNAGMKVAQGEWTYFLDSDDWLHPEAMQKLYSFASENDCDIVQGGQYYAYSDHLLYRQPTRNEECQTVLTNDEAMRLLIINDRVKNFAWGKLYRTELIRDIEFPVGKYFEDSYWQHLVFSRVNKYGIVDTPLYYYRQRDNGISGEFSDRNLDLLKGYEDRLKFIQLHYPGLTTEMVHTLWSCIRSLSECAKNCKDEKIRKVYEKYFHDMHQKYYSLFEAYLKDDITWTMGKYPRLLHIISFVKLVCNRLFGSNHYKSVSM